MEMMPGLSVPRSRIAPQGSQLAPLAEQYTRTSGVPSRWRVGTSTKVPATTASEPALGVTLASGKTVDDQVLPPSVECSRSAEPFSSGWASATTLSPSAVTALSSRILVEAPNWALSTRAQARPSVEIQAAGPEPPSRRLALPTATKPVAVLAMSLITSASWKAVRPLDSTAVQL